MFGQLGGVIFTSKHLFAHKVTLTLTLTLTLALTLTLTHNISLHSRGYKKKTESLWQKLYYSSPSSKSYRGLPKKMGYIDRHNRFRQNILGLAKVWRTKKWQVRVILEIFGMAVVDSFLLARKFIPRWQNANTDDGVFWLDM